MTGKTGGKRKTNPKKQKKADRMWLEQLYFKIDAIEKRLDILEQTVNYISQELQDIKRNGDKNDRKS